MLRNALNKFGIMFIEINEHFFFGKIVEIFYSHLRSSISPLVNKPEITLHLWIVSYQFFLRSVVNVYHFGFLYGLDVKFTWTPMLVSFIIGDPPVLYRKFCGLFNSLFVHKKLSETAIHYKIVITANLSCHQKVLFLFYIQFCKK